MSNKTPDTTVQDIRNALRKPTTTGTAEQLHHRDAIARRAVMLEGR